MVALFDLLDLNFLQVALIAALKALLVPTVLVAVYNHCPFTPGAYGELNRIFLQLTHLYLVSMLLINFNIA